MKSIAIVSLGLRGQISEIYESTVHETNDGS